MRERRLARKARLVVLMSIIAASFIFAVFALSIPSVPDTPDMVPTSSRTVVLTPHDPIVIDGDSDFASQASSQGWPGDGSVEDPYVIEGYEIDATGQSYAICVKNTVIYFSVNDCYLYQASVSVIALLNVTNAILDNNTCWSTIPSSYANIYLYSSSGNLLRNNTCWQYGKDAISISSSTNNVIEANVCYMSYRGIELYYSDDNRIINNTCSSNGLRGISLEYSSNNSLGNNNCSSNSGSGLAISNSGNNEIVNNTCSQDHFGIFLDSSNDNTLGNNTCSQNTVDLFLQSSSNNDFIDNSWLESQGGVHLVSHSTGNTFENNAMIGVGIVIDPTWSTLADWCTQSIDTSNTVNGSPIFYYRNEIGVTVPSGAGQVILANCTNMVISNESLIDTDIGIQLGYSWENVLQNNNCSSNSLYGIFLHASDGNIIRNNTCSENQGNGVFVDSSNGNTLMNNSCSLNNGDSGNGIVLAGSSVNNLTGNSCFGNAQFGLNIVDRFSRDNMIWNNSFYQNNGAGATYDPLHAQACDWSSGNRWNSTDGYGNYWSDWTTPDIDPPDGIVDAPYDISGDADAKDYYPLTTPQAPIPEFGMMPLVVLAILVAVLLTREAGRSKAD